MSRTPLDLASITAKPGYRVVSDSRKATQTLAAPQKAGEGARVGTAKRLRQSSKPVLNKLEARFQDYMFKSYDALFIHAQAVRLELARGIWYKPDFFVAPHPLCTRATFYEVKGPRSFRGGFENLKVAARVHSWAKFFLVWENRDTGLWERQEILP